MKILIDIDGITANLLPHWLYYIQALVTRQGDGELARKIARMDPITGVTEWELHKCTPLDAVDPKKIYDVLNTHQFFETMPVMYGATDAIRHLVEAKHEVYLVTARYGNYAHQETIAWVKKYFPFLDAEKQLIFAYDKHLLRADVLIDDKPQTLSNYKLYHPESEVLGIKYAYNEHLDSKIYKLFPYGHLAWGMIAGYIQGL